MPVVFGLPGGGGGAVIVPPRVAIGFNEFISPNTRSFYFGIEKDGSAEEGGGTHAPELPGTG